MRIASFVAAGLAFGLVAWTVTGAAGAPDIGADDLPFLRLPDGPNLPLPPGSHAFGPNGPSLRGSGGNPGVTTPLAPPAAKAPVAKPEPPKTREAVLDDLFHRLSEAENSDQAGGVALAIQHVWLQSGSDTADLLMSRAMTAVEKGDRALAIRLLDKIVALDPDWAEGWNRRATLRYLNDDDFGSMDDISHVLKLEPRHFGAMTGMASILLRHDMKRNALELLRKAAAVYPHNGDMEKLIGELIPDVEGRGI